MPFKFWKREKAEKEKGAPEEKKGGEPAKPPTVASEETAKGAAPAAPVEPKPAAKEAVKAEKLPEPSAEVLEETISEIHKALVDLGLTIPGTKGIFSKRVATYPGGAGAFMSTYKQKPYRAATTILVDWLGFRAPGEFDPAKLLNEVNLRLSSFKLSIQMSDLTWLDKELSLRKARLRLGDQDRVARFKDARDFVKGVNELLGPKKLAFLELETWSDEFAFLLVRDPKWDKLASTTLVVVKAPQTAVGGECGECGAPVGANWHDCLSCGAVFGTE